MFGRRPNPVFGPDYARAHAVLLRARRRAGLSQRALAQALGKATSHVTRIERGQRRIDLLEFLAMARVLGRDPAELIAELAREIAGPAPVDRAPPDAPDANVPATVRMPGRGPSAEAAAASFDPTGFRSGDGRSSPGR